MKMQHQLRAASVVIMSLGVVCSVRAQNAPDTATAEPAAFSGPALEEVVVTVERRESSIQRTAASVASVSGSDVNGQGLSTIDDVLKNVAGVVVQGQAKGFTPAIRGLGTDLPPGSAEGSVATNFDGMYDIRAESGAGGYFDINRVEILRGPQGTLYGRNATAGVVNVISNNPVLDDESGSVTVEGGNYSLGRGEAVANLPIGDSLALRAAGTVIRRHGYLSNGLDDNDSEAARLKLRYEPSPAFSLLTGAQFIHLDGNGASGVPAYANGAAPSHPWYTPPVVSGLLGPIDTTDTARDYRSYKVWSQLDWDVGIGVLTFLPSYSKANESEHGCFEANCMSSAGDPQSLHQVSDELRLASKSSSPVRWAAGYYHYNYSQLTVQNSLTPVPELQTTTARAYSDAVFGQLTLTVADKLRLVGGGRETSDRKTRITTANFPFPTDITGSGRWNHFDWKAGVEYDAAPQSLLYASASTGYRPGGFNPDGSTFKPETLTSYEIGSKNRFFDSRLQLNGDAYYYNYRQYQAFDFIVNPAPQFVFYNVDKVDDYGAELEAEALVTRYDTLSLAAAYLHAAFASPVFIHLGAPTLPATDLNGDPLPHSPEWTVNGQLEHLFPLPGGATLSARGIVRYVSGQYTGPDLVPFAYQPGNITGDLLAVFLSARGKWGLTGYVKNVSDRPIKTAYVNGYNTLAAPRTYGLVFTASFGGR